MAGARKRYRTAHADSARWDGFSFRPGDIVISTRSRSGTTWMQMICALLVFQTPDLPAPLPELSPWLDWLVLDRTEVMATLAAQEHRRFIKTHTPLDGVPLEPRVTYVVVARHPLDMAVSLYHHLANLDTRRIAQLEGHPDPADPAPAGPLREWLVSWIAASPSPQDRPDSLPGVIWHTRDAWSRRPEPNVILIHYDDLIADLDGQMRRLAGRLGIEVPAGVWPGLVEAAGLASMRARAERLTPGPAGIFHDHAAFFRRGRPGAAHAVLTADELAGYSARVAAMAPADLLAWLHRSQAATRPGLRCPDQVSRGRSRS